MSSIRIRYAAEDRPAPDSPRWGEGISGSDDDRARLESTVAIKPFEFIYLCICLVNTNQFVIKFNFALCAFL